jgi:hypothetical protein
MAEKQWLMSSKKEMDRLLKRMDYLITHESEAEGIS